MGGLGGDIGAGGLTGVSGDRTVIGFPFTTAGNAIQDNSTAWDRLRGITLGDDEDSSDQYARVTAQATANGSAGKIAFALVHSQLGVIGYYPATVTAQSRRAGVDGATGAYTCSVAFDQSGSCFIDLSSAVSKLPAGGSIDWYVGCPDLGGLTALAVQVSFGRKI